MVRTKKVNIIKHYLKVLRKIIEKELKINIPDEMTKIMAVQWI